MLSLYALYNILTGKVVVLLRDGIESSLAHFVLLINLGTFRTSDGIFFAISNMYRSVCLFFSHLEKVYRLTSCTCALLLTSQLM